MSSITVFALYADIQKSISLKEINSTVIRHTPQDFFFKNSLLLLFGETDSLRQVITQLKS